MLGEGSGRSYGRFESGQDLRDKIQRIILLLKGARNILNIPKVPGLSAIYRPVWVTSI